MDATAKAPRAPSLAKKIFLRKKKKLEAALNRTPKCDPRGAS